MRASLYYDGVARDGWGIEEGVQHHGLCMPGMNYMVDVSGRVEKMRAMVDAGEYFCVNRARQYGKTTTLASLEDVLASDYVVAVRTFRPYRTRAFVRRVRS